MLKKMLIVSSFVLLGSVAGFAQNSADNCPADQVQERVEVNVDLGVVSGTYERTECSPKEATEPKEAKDTPEPKDAPEMRDPPDRPTE